jgi:hypothetical protein
MTGGHRTARLRRLAAAIVILGVSILPQTASALTRREATAVLDVIERLQPTFGRFAYHEEIADDWFERDAEGDRVIAKAGFSADGWRTALREIYSGYLAALPDAELQDVFSGLKQGIEKMKHLDAAQKKELLQDIDEQIRAMMVRRKEGAAFVDIVRPLVPRIKALRHHNSSKR